ncbi:hypothetical protein [Vibrio sp. UBA2437]
MHSIRKQSKSLATKTSSANRRKRMLANNKKKVIWRHRAYVHGETFD